MKINRLFEIIYILLDKEKVSAKELAERFEVSIRTIYRDIDTLSEAGIPVYTTNGKSGGISLLPNFILNKAVLTDEEKSEILSSLSAVSAVNLSENDTALSKLSSLFGGTNTDWLEVDFSGWYNANKETKNFNILKAATISKSVVTFSYINAKGEETSRSVEPLRLCYKGISRYLYGYCTLRKDFRFFKLSRMKNLAVTDVHFDKVLLAPILKGVAITDTEYIKLKLRLNPKVAFRVYDEFEIFEKQEDGSFICEIIFPNEEHPLFSYISSFGTACEILEPLWLRQQYKNTLQEIIEKY